MSLRACSLLLLVSVPGLAAAQTPHQVIRVSKPEEKNPKEVAVAINPTNPDHIVAVAHHLLGRGQRALVR